MEFKKMVTITLYVKQKKRHRCTEQTFGLCGRRWRWDVQREQHWNKYTIKGETDHQPRLDAWDGCSGLAGALGRPRGMWWGWRREGGSRWGTHVNPWLIPVNVWQKPLHYCKVISLQLIKINGEKKSAELLNDHIESFRTQMLKFACYTHSYWIQKIQNVIVLYLYPQRKDLEGRLNNLRPNQRIFEVSKSVLYFSFCN